MSARHGMQRGGLRSGQDSGTKKERALERAGKGHCPALVCLRERRMRACLGCLLLTPCFPVDLAQFTAALASPRFPWSPGQLARGVQTLGAECEHSFRCFLRILDIRLSRCDLVKACGALMCGYQSSVPCDPWIEQQALKRIPTPYPHPHPISPTPTSLPLNHIPGSQGSQEDRTWQRTRFAEIRL